MNTRVNNFSFLDSTGSTKFYSQTQEGDKKFKLTFLQVVHVAAGEGNADLEVVGLITSLVPGFLLLEICHFVYARWALHQTNHRCSMKGKEEREKEEESGTATPKFTPLNWIWHLHTKGILFLHLVPFQAKILIFPQIREHFIYFSRPASQHHVRDRTYYKTD